MMELTLLHLSSNQLESLPSSLLQCTSLEYLYLNSNHLTAVPSGLADALILLKCLTLSHNRLTALSPDFIERFGEPKDKCDLDPTCIVTLACNPILNDKRDAMDVV
jgi:Leucine-rich repeat (LRR) protein